MSATTSVPETVPALLAAARDSDTALIYRGQRWSRAELDVQSRHVAGALAARGIGMGDRVGLWLPNCPAYVLLYLACARLGAIAVAVNTRYRRVEVQDIIGRARCKALACWPGFRGIDFAGMLREMDPAIIGGLGFLIAYEDEGGAGPVVGVESVPFARLLDAPALVQDHATPETPCNIFTTSGTTSAPKFVLHRQGAIVRHARDVARRFGYDSGDARLLQTVPLCGVFGFDQFLGALAGGAVSVMMPAFEAEEAARLVREHGITHTCGADDMAARLLAAGVGARPFPTLRHFAYARFNAALGDIVERAEARGVTLCGLYGSSEVQALFSVQRGDAPAAERKLPGGVPVAEGVRIRARHPETGEILPHGEPGELEIRAPSVMIGYDGNEEATRAAFTEDGYFRSGDLGYTRADGGFVYLSRAGDVLRLGGFLVSPAEIEAHLSTHEAVDGCQVVGIETARGTVAIAFVTLRPGAPVEEAALQAHCKSALAAFKMPARVFAIDAFPTTESANGTKIQRNRLREWAGARLGDGTREAG